MLSWLFRRRTKFTDVEAEVLRSVVAALPERSASMMRAQIALMNKVQRIDHGREVDLYRIEHGKPAFPESALFARREEEIRLAEVRLLDEETGHATDALLTVVAGRLFSIEFAHSPRDLQGSCRIRATVLSLVDPMSDPRSGG